VTDPFELRITPEPSAHDAEAILAAVRETLRREAELAQPAAWRIAGWTQTRVGLVDLGRSVEAHRRWPLSCRLPEGGRVFGGLNGRGDAK
jgi:hypothetical protein